MSKSKKAPKYNFKSIERKWQKKWEREKAYQPDLDRAKKPFYNLMMFPYPSAEGLHVGSAYTFSGVDTYGRFKKMQGYDVFEPIGLDGFGIHSENYALKIGEHIKDVSKRTEKTYYRQLHQIGNMHDWSRTVETYKPEYYKWTQWLFLQMYKRGLAYQQEASVNWCPSCKTVLSDEQVIAGKCERCESLVRKKRLRQWFFAITKYADRLLENLSWINWPDDVKLNQKNWIGKSVGCTIRFEVKSQNSKVKTTTQKLKPRNYKPSAASYLEVFTTRPDTLFGATYMVVAPEHEILENQKSKIKNQKEVFSYVEKALRKTEQQRKNDEKTKTGVEVKGIKAINPVNNEKIPIWVADYVLAGYGTGAIMAVPAHDQRDYEFAKKFNLPVRQVVAQHIYDAGEDKPKKGKRQVTRNVVTAIVKHWAKDEYLLLDWQGQDWKCFIMGGIEQGEDAVKAAAREVREETGFKNLEYICNVGGEIHVEFYAKHKGVNRYAKNQGVFFELKDGQRLSRRKGEKDKHDFFWVGKKELENVLNVEGHKLLWQRLSDGDFCFAGEGVSVNSGFISGLKTKEAKQKIVKMLAKEGMGKQATDYKLRDWCISRQRYWGPPIPIVWCRRCALDHKPKAKGKKNSTRIKVLMIHGFGGSSQGNWFPWMRQELEKLGCDVYAPTMSTSTKPELNKWLKELMPYFKRLDENSIIIGHSLGSKAAVHLLEKNDKKVGKLISVAGALGDYRKDPDWKEHQNDPVGKFISKKVNWKKVDKNIGEAHFIVSREDRWIDAKHYQKIKLARQFNEVLRGYSHFAKKKYPFLKDYVFETILKDIDPVAVPVPEKDLPVKLPPMEDFLPEGKGKGPLAKNKNFVNTRCPACGSKTERETDVSDPFVDSSWYFFRYPSTDFDDRPFDRKRTKKWLPVDSYIGGKEHTVLHLLYSRFVTMVLNDLGYIDFEEPYLRFFGHGLITKDGAKMSKSKGNVVNPDEMIEKYGADTMRLYLRFLGDFSQGGDWRDSGIEGMHKFVKRMWKLFFEIEGTGPGVASTSMIDKTVKSIGQDLDKLSFNTAVARLMEYVNWIKDNKEGFNKEQADKCKRTLALVIAPMAPHLAEELWSALGNGNSVTAENWPSYEEQNVIDEQIELVVQVNGKLRDRLIVPKDITEDQATARALESDKAGKFVGDQKIKKVIYVPGRLVNIVV